MLIWALLLGETQTSSATPGNDTGIGTSDGGATAGTNESRVGLSAQTNEATTPADGM